MTNDFRFYLALFFRRLPLFLIIFVLITTIGVFAAFTLPPVYRSQVRLLVESAQIPGDLAESTVQMPAQEQLQIFETRLLTRENLLDVANNLLVLPNQSEMSPDEIVQAMRAATGVKSSTGRDQATLMSLTFDNTNPTKAAAVLNEYLTIILEEDAQYRSSRAGQTQQFFQQEVSDLDSRLSQASARILDFKNANADALPEGLNYRRDQQQELTDRIVQLDREITSLEGQKATLTQVFETTGSSSTATATQLSPEERRLQELRSQLADLEAVYAPENPRITVLRNRIQQLEQSIIPGANVATPNEDPARAMFDLQIASIDERIDQLSEDRDRYSDQLAVVEDAIARTPANAIALEALQRDYDNIQGQYNAAVDRLAKATTGERIETLSRGQRVTVIEQPVVPDQPFKPNRKLVAAAGMLVGAALGAGVILLLEMLDTSVKRSADLTAKLGITPLATIPYMRTSREKNQQRLRRIMISLLIGLAIPTALFLVHTFYMPFDVLAQKIAARVGLYL